LVARVDGQVTRPKLTYQHIFLEAGAWLQNDKAICDLSFMLAFHEEWLNKEMLFAQGISAWHKAVPPLYQRAGYRAGMYPVHTVLARRSLAALGSTDVILGLESFFKKNYARHREGLDTTPGSNEELSMQGVYFVEAALKTHGNRSHRWLGPLLDCVIADPNPVVALEATRVVVAVYDGQDKDVPVELIGGTVTVEVEGQTVDLRELLEGELVQLITPEILHDDSVLYVRSETATDIKEWVKNGGTFCRRKRPVARVRHQNLGLRQAHPQPLERAHGEHRQSSCAEARQARD
jgi:hypothetical protein